MKTKLTKKEFNDGCNVQVYGRGLTKRNAIYYGVMRDELGNWCGYQYMIKAQVCQYKIQELRNMLYYWVTGEGNRPVSVITKYAESCDEAFKISLIG